MDMNEATKAIGIKLGKMMEETGLSWKDVLAAIDAGMPVEDFLKLDENSKEDVMRALWALYVLAMKTGIATTVSNIGLAPSEEVGPVINELMDEINDMIGIINAEVYGMDGIGNDSLHIVKE